MLGQVALNSLECRKLLIISTLQQF